MKQEASKEELAKYHARQIALFNAEIIFYNKNKLMLIDEKFIKDFKIRGEKMFFIIKNSYPKANPDLLVANIDNKANHDLTKLDVDLIEDALLESLEEKDAEGGL